MLTLGGLIGGFVAARHGLQILAVVDGAGDQHAEPAYVFLAYTQPENSWIVVAALAIEQFGYGFGFTAYMLYMIYASQGPSNQTVALRALHRPDGAGHDDARYVQRLAAGADRLPALLRVGHAGHHPRFLDDGPDPARPRIWQTRRRRRGSTPQEPDGPPAA